MRTHEHASQSNAHMRHFIAHGMTARWVDGVWQYSPSKVNRKRGGGK